VILRRALAPFVAATLSCGCADNPPPPTRAPSLPEAPPIASHAPEPRPNAPLQQLLCGPRPRCGVRRERPAGAGGDGAKLSVVSLDLGVESTGSTPVPETVSGAHDLDEGEAIDVAASLGFGVCHRYEYWLVVQTPSATSRQLLVSVCNDGHGAAGVGEDTMEVRSNEFRYQTSGGSSWRWSFSCELSLSPLRLLRMTSTSDQPLGGNNEETAFDFTTFAGRRRGSIPRCDAKGELVEGAPEVAFEHDVLPRVELGEAFRAGGFRSTALGACALRLGAGKGLVTFAEKGAASQAWIGALLSTRDELFVEVHDDRPSGASASWVKDDHVELWLADESSSIQRCLGALPPPEQWGIRVADGKVFAGHGAPAAPALRVERATADGVVRLKIALPPRKQAITVAYSDGDGKRQRVVVASSRAAKGRAETLGTALDLTRSAWTCAERAGRLEPRSARSPDPERPFIPFP
jgi:hypothetical protein